MRKKYTVGKISLESPCINALFHPRIALNLLNVTLGRDNMVSLFFILALCLAFTFCPIIVNQGLEIFFLKKARSLHGGAFGPQEIIL